MGRCRRSSAGWWRRSCAGPVSRRARRWETADAEHNIPRALIGTLALTGVLFVVVMFAQTIGFGTDKAGLDAFERSANTLGDLGNIYIGEFSACW